MWDQDGERKRGGKGEGKISVTDNLVRNKDDICKGEQRSIPSSIKSSCEQTLKCWWAKRKINTKTSTLNDLRMPFYWVYEWKVKIKSAGKGNKSRLLLKEINLVKKCKNPAK